MADPTILNPVSESDPCGPDMRWDPDFGNLEHAFDMATSSVDDVVDGEPEPAAGDGFKEIIASAGRLCASTKDMRVLALRAEACWRDAGLAAFADALADLVAVAEAWPDPGAGFHPRADEEDGDLSERNAPLSRLVGRIPLLVEVRGWGTPPSPTVQQDVRAALAEIFEGWTSRLEPAFGEDIASPRDAWTALRKLVGDAVPPAPPEAEGEPAAAGVADVVPVPVVAAANAWDALNHALELMTLQNGHSPAIPVLRLLSTWRDADILEIVEMMRDTGVTLEQLLDAVRKPLDAA